MSSDDTKPAHSPLGASSMERWQNCPGSIRLSRGIPNTESVYAQEGTKAHELAERILTTGEIPPDTDPEMLEAVLVYVNYIRTLTGEE
jgi:hypothetical protein